MDYDAELFSKALDYAVRLHADQRRKSDGSPYISHLLAVSGLVMENGGSMAACIGALLHDAAEDAGGEKTLAEIRDMFGDDVANIVDGCSDTKVSPKPPWKERKEAHIDHMWDAPSDVRMVVAADKLHNIRGLIISYIKEGEKVWGYFKGGKNGTLWYYRSMADVLSAQDENPLVGQLCCALGKLEELSCS